MGRTVIAEIGGHRPVLAYVCEVGLRGERSTLRYGMKGTRAQGWPGTPRSRSANVYGNCSQGSLLTTKPKSSGCPGLPLVALACTLHRLFGWGQNILLELV